MQTHRFRPPLEAASADDGVVWSRTCDDARCLARCCWTSCWAPFSVWQPPCRSYSTSLSSPSQGSRRRRTNWSQRTAGSPQTSRPVTTRIRCIARSTAIPRDFTLIDTRFCPDHAWQTIVSRWRPDHELGYPRLDEQQRTFEEIFIAFFASTANESSIS